MNSRQLTRYQYPIKKSKIGYYFIIRFLANPEIISSLERFYKLDENIIRFLTIKLSLIELEQLEKNKTPQIQEDSESDTKGKDTVEENEILKDDDIETQ